MRSRPFRSFNLPFSLSLDSAHLRPSLPLFLFSLLSFEFSPSLSLLFPLSISLRPSTASSMFQFFPTTLPIPLPLDFRVLIFSRVLFISLFLSLAIFLCLCFPIFSVVPSSSLQFSVFLRNSSAFSVFACFCFLSIFLRSFSSHLLIFLDLSISFSLFFAGSHDRRQ